MYDNPTDLAALRTRDLPEEAAASRGRRLARLAKASRAESGRAARRAPARLVLG